MRILHEFTSISFFNKNYFSISKDVIKYFLLSNQMYFITRILLLKVIIVCNFVRTQILHFIDDSFDNID